MSVMNLTNDKIEWAKWTWNPVTGCRHGCKYCYARDISKSKGITFEPRFHKYRLDAPANTPTPEHLKYARGINHVFVCSMADLFGEWVPANWIQTVLNVCKKNKQWTFIFLTKNPERYHEFEFPKNSWVGATVDTQERADRVHEVFKDLIYVPFAFVSCEPLLEPIEFEDIGIFDWLIIGGQSKTRKCPAFQPKWKWVYNLTKDATENKVKVYWKPNLKVRPRQFPAK